MLGLRRGLLRRGNRGGSGMVCSGLVNQSYPSLDMAVMHLCYDSLLCVYLLSCDGVEVWRLCFRRCNMCMQRAS
jgi:hypothetical protein